MVTKKQEILNNLAVLLSSNEQDFLESVFSSYLDTLNTHSKALATALEAKDLKAIRNSAHAIKGCAGTVQHTEIMELTLHLEEFADSNDLLKCKELIIKLKDYMEKIGFNI